MRLSCILLFAVMSLGGISSMAETAGHTAVGSNVNYPDGGMLEVPAIEGLFNKDFGVTEFLMDTTGTTVWFGLASHPPQILRYNLATHAPTGELVISTSDYGTLSRAVIDPANKFAYFMYYTDTYHGSRLYKIDLQAMTVAGQLDFDVSNRFDLAISMDPSGKNVYLGTRTVPGRILRVNLGNFQHDATLGLPPTEGQVIASGIDRTSTYGYFHVVSGGYKLVRVKLSDFSRIDSITLPYMIEFGRRFTFEPTGYYLYIPYRDTNPAIIGRLNLSSFALEQALTVGAAGTALDFFTDAAGAFGYAPLSSGDIAYFNLSSLIYLGLFGAVPYALTPTAALQFPLNPKKFLICSSKTSAVEVASITNNTAVHSAPLVLPDSNEDGFKTMVSDPDFRHAYLLTTGNFAKILKLDLTRRQLQGSTFISLTNPVGAAAIDNNFGAVGLNKSTYSESHMLTVDWDRLHVSKQASIPGRTTFDSISLANPTNIVARGIADSAFYVKGLRRDLTEFKTLTAGNASGLDNGGDVIADPALDAFWFMQPDVSRLFYSIGGTLSASVGLTPKSYLLLRHPLTGGLYSISTSPTNAVLSEFDPNNLIATRTQTLLPGYKHGEIRRGVIDPAGGSLYYMSSYDYLVYKQNLTNLAIQTSTTLGGALPNAMLVNPEGSLLSFCYSVNRILRVATTPRERIAASRLTIPVTAEINSVSFYAHEPVGPRRVEVEPQLSNSQSVFKNGIINKNAGRAYFVTDQNPARLVAFDCATRATITTASLPAGDTYVESAAIDPAGSFGYFGTFTSPGRVLKVRLSDLTRQSALTLQAGEDNLRAAVVDPAGQFLYVASANSPAIIIKIRLSDFTRVGALALDDGEELPRGMVIANGFLYVGCAGFPGAVVKIRLSDFTRIAALVPAAGEEQPGPLAVDPANTFLYAASTGFPAHIIKIRLSDFTRVGALPLETAETNPVDMAMSSDGRFLLAACDSFPVAIARIDLATFTRGGGGFLRLNLESNIRSILLDGQNRYAFIGCGTDPGRIVTFEPEPKPLRLALYTDYGMHKSLVWQSSPLAVTNPNAWLTVPISAGSPTWVKVNPGKYWLAWQCDADENVPSCTTGGSQDGLVWRYAAGDFPQLLDRWGETSARWSGYVSYTNRNSSTGWTSWN